MALPYKVSTLLYCFDEAGNVLLLERAQEPNRGLWSPPGGKLHQSDGESPHACACREAFEELGVELVPADLHLTGIVSERGYMGQAHWLMFLFEVKKRLTSLPPPHREGRFALVPPHAIAGLPLPETDRQQIWPLFWKHRGGFFSAHCRCDAPDSHQWTLEESHPDIAAGAASDGDAPGKRESDATDPAPTQPANEAEAGGQPDDGPIIDLVSDTYFMGEALRQATRAYSADEVPVGAVVVRQGRIIARAHNQVERLKDATAHAEMLAITQAQQAVGDWRLTDCTLYVTKEPCPMCAGAAVHVRFQRVVYGAPDPKGGAAGGATNLLQFPSLNHQCGITPGVRESECRQLLRSFFQEQRAKRNAPEDGGIARN